MRHYISGMLFTTAFLFIPFFISAQNQIDALRYSRMQFGSTARSLATGGAFSALGADLSVLSTNPGGLGLYRNGDINFTPAFYIRSVDSKYLDKNLSDSKVQFGFSNLGIVAVSQNGSSSPWKRHVISFGYNKLASFNTNSYFEGFNQQNSLLTNFVEQSQGLSASTLSNNSAFDLNLAFQTCAIDTSSDGNYYSGFPNAHVMQSRLFESRGSIGEWSFGYGGTLEEKLYLGASLNFPTIRYDEVSLYEESDIQHDSSLVCGADLDAITYRKDLLTKGNGINLKFGMIVRPSDYVRLGIAIHTPTYFVMKDYYSSRFTSNFTDGSSYSEDSPAGFYQYNLTTPFRMLASVAFMFGQAGFLTGEYEYVDYANAKLKAPDYSFSQENSAIKGQYTSSHNVRLGAEAKLDNISLRFGASYAQSPYEGDSQSISESNSRNTIGFSGGFGYKYENWYLDVGYAFNSSKEYYQPYTVNNGLSPVSLEEIKEHRLLITTGWRF
ncbi:MAG TPA: hypothetical protein PKM16_02390 [Bacteroidia bacterium]|nr:hypothetical protein [Bacteroidia bacterium]